MAQKQYTYLRQGITAAYLAQKVPGTGTVGPLVPAAFQTHTWDETYKDDLDAAMAAQGYAYGYEGPSPSAKMIAEIKPFALLVDGDPISENGWVALGSVELQTLGGSSIGVHVTAVGNTQGAHGQVRVLINGGSFTDTVIGAVQYDLHDASYGNAAFNAPKSIPSTAPDVTTYTITLQMHMTGAGTITPRAGTTMTVIEYR